MAWLLIYYKKDADTLDDRDMHVVPDFGPPHTESLECFCCPVRDKQTPSVVVHNEIH